MSRAIPEDRRDVGQAPPGGHSPGASPLPAAAAASPGWARIRPGSVKSQRSITIAFLAGFVVATVIFALLAPSRAGSPYEAKQFYQQIKLGMTRAEVLRLMQPSERMHTTIESTDIMILDERFMIAVTYGPAPPKPAQVGTMFGQPADDWVVKEKVYVDHQRRGVLESIATALGMRPERMVSDRVREH
jgi:hypothetical protein